MELDGCPAKGHPDLTSVLSVATGPWPEQMKPKQRDAETLGHLGQPLLPPRAEINIPA